MFKSEKPVRRTDLESELSKSRGIRIESFREKDVTVIRCTTENEKGVEMLADNADAETSAAGKAVIHLIATCPELWRPGDKVQRVLKADEDPEAMASDGYEWSSEI